MFPLLFPSSPSSNRALFFQKLGSKEQRDLKKTSEHKKTKRRRGETATSLHEGEDISDHIPTSVTAGACLSRQVGNERFRKSKPNKTGKTKCKRRDDRKIAAQESQVQVRSGKSCPSARGKPPTFPLSLKGKRRVGDPTVWVVPLLYAVHSSRWRPTRCLLGSPAAVLRRDGWRANHRWPCRIRTCIDRIRESR